MKRYLYAFLAACVVVSASGTVWAQAAPGNAPVSREEFDDIAHEVGLKKTDSNPNSPEK